MRLIDADKLNLYSVLRPYCSFDATCAITDIIDNEPTVNPYEWISVEDRLPNIPTFDILIYRKRLDGTYEITLGGYFKSGFKTSLFESFPHVTHWMPLPAPPKEG